MLLSEISILLVRAICEIWSSSYESLHTSQPHSNTTFVHTYTCNWKTTRRMQTFYIPNDCSTIRDVYFMCYSWIWDTNGEVLLQACISLFLISHSCVYSVLGHITWKRQVLLRGSAYWTIAILSETFFVWFRVVLEIWLESYGPRHTWSFSDTTLCVYTASLYMHRYLVRNYYAW